MTSLAPRVVPTDVANKPNGQSPFLDMPYELRDQVYTILLLRSSPIEPQYINLQRPSSSCTYDYRYEDVARRQGDVSGILRASGQMSTEALDTLYGRNLFRFNLHAGRQEALRQFGPSNLRRIRRLMLVAQPMGTSYGSELVLDPDIWQPLLEGLQSLTLVLAQPAGVGGVAKLGEWERWLTPILQYIGSHMSGEVAVEVDDNEEPETAEIVEACLPKGHRRVKNEVGDRCFGRGIFGWSFENDDSWCMGGCALFARMREVL